MLTPQDADRLREIAKVLTITGWQAGAADLRDLAARIRQHIEADKDIAASVLKQRIKAGNNGAPEPAHGHTFGESDHTAVEAFHRQMQTEADQITAETYDLPYKTPYTTEEELDRR